MPLFAPPSGSILAQLVQANPQLAAVFGQQNMQPTMTPTSLGAQPRQGVNPTAPAEAPGVGTPPNQQVPQPQSPVDFNKILQQIYDQNAKQGALNQAEAQRKLGIGPFEEGHPIRKARHTIEDVIGTLFELHGRRAPWLEQRQSVMSPEYPAQSVELQNAGLGGQETLMRLQEAQRQHDLMNSINLGRLGQGQEKIEQTGQVNQEKLNQGQQRINQGDTRLAQGQENIGLKRGELDWKKDFAERKMALQDQWMRVRDQSQLDTSYRNEIARVDSAMMSDEDKANYKKELTDLYQTYKMGRFSTQPTPSSTKQDPTERSTSGSDPLGIR